MKPGETEKSADVSNAAVSVVGVSKMFASTFAVRNINLDVNEGEFFSFLGPSGCGKTTLLRMIAGFETPTDGKILLGGSDTTTVPPHKRPVNMVFQNYALFPHLTIADNVAFALNLKNVEKSEVAKRVDDALSLVRLEHLKDRLPSQLSGGQQQRAALARAVINGPKVLLLDEPLSALDPQIREEMQVELASLQKRLNMTFIMVTHDQDEALALSSRIAVFQSGSLEQVGSPEVVFGNPATLFVAKFIGQTNVIEAELVESNLDYRVLKFLDGQICFSTDLSKEMSVGSRVAVLVKPHQVQIVEPPSGSSSRNVYAAKVLNVSFNGANSDYLLRFGDKNEIRAHLDSTKYGALAASESVSLHLPAAHCNLLPI